MVIKAIHVHIVTVALCTTGKKIWPEFGWISLHSCVNCPYHNIRFNWNNIPLPRELRMYQQITTALQSCKYSDTRSDLINLPPGLIKSLVPLQSEKNPANIFSFKSNRMQFKINSGNQATFSFTNVRPKGILRTMSSQKVTVAATVLENNIHLSIELSMNLRKTFFVQICKCKFLSACIICEQRGKIQCTPLNYEHRLRFVVPLITLAPSHVRLYESPQDLFRTNL